MSEREPIKVALVSDQAIFLRGLVSMILSFPETRLVGEAHTAAEAVQLCQLTEPELLVFSFANVVEPPCEVARLVRHKWPTIQVVAMADFEADSPYLVELNELRCYRISRSVSEEELKAALDQIWQERQQWLQNSASGAASVHFRHGPEEDTDPPIPELPSPDSAANAARSEEMRGRELVMAGRIQEDILPEKEPDIPGWEIAARLKPARETSGDFYDFIPLSEHKIGLVIADVTDKGMGAALFMALTSTLLRTYAVRFPTLPGLVLNTVSERILADTRGGMFVTTLYGVLEPITGRFIFANAGHPPGCLISRRHGRVSLDRLNPTGMALGVSEEAQWKQKVIKLAPGDVLVLYTDGITEANNPQGVFYGEDRLLDVLLSHPGRRAAEICDAVLENLHHFTGPVPAQDDIALIVIRRQEESG